MIRGEKYNGLLVDIWSSGIVLYAMLCGFLPFDDSNNEVLYRKIIEGKFNIPHFISDNGKDILKKILNVDPSKRYNINLIKNHPWFNLINPNINMNEGLLLFKYVIPIDEDLVEKMEEFYNDKEDIRRKILSNRHNHITTTYYLLLKKKTRLGLESVAELKSNSFKEYIKDPSNLLSCYDNNIDNVTKERAPDKFDDDYFKINNHSSKVEFLAMEILKKYNNNKNNNNNFNNCNSNNCFNNCNNDIKKSSKEISTVSGSNDIKFNKDDNKESFNQVLTRKNSKKIQNDDLINKEKYSSEKKEKKKIEVEKKIFKKIVISKKNSDVNDKIKNSNIIKNKLLKSKHHYSTSMPDKTGIEKYNLTQRLYNSKKINNSVKYKDKNNISLNTTNNTKYDILITEKINEKIINNNNISNKNNNISNKNKTCKNKIINILKKEKINKKRCLKSFNTSIEGNFSSKKKSNHRYLRQSFDIQNINLTHKNSEKDFPKKNTKTKMKSMEFDSIHRSTETDKEKFNKIINYNKRKQYSISLRANKKLLDKSINVSEIVNSSFKNNENDNKINNDNLFLRFNKNVVTSSKLTKDFNRNNNFEIKKQNKRFFNTSISFDKTYEDNKTNKNRNTSIEKDIIEENNIQRENSKTKKEKDLKYLKMKSKNKKFNIVKIDNEIKEEKENIEEKENERINTLNNNNNYNNHVNKNQYFIFHDYMKNVLKNKKKYQKFVNKSDFTEKNYYLNTETLDSKIKKNIKKEYGVIDLSCIFYITFEKLNESIIKILNKEKIRYKKNKNKFSCWTNDCNFEIDIIKNDCFENGYILKFYKQKVNICHYIDMIRNLIEKIK